MVEFFVVLFAFRELPVQLKKGENCEVFNCPFFSKLRLKVCSAGSNLFNFSINGLLPVGMHFAACFGVVSWRNPKLVFCIEATRIIMKIVTK